MSKTLKIDFSAQDRFGIYVHLTQNVATQNAKEQDEYNDLWESFRLDEIEAAVEAKQKADSKQAITKLDFDSAPEVIELTKDEAGYFVAFCGRAMAGTLSRMIRPLRLRVAEARDKAGMKSVPAEG